MTDRSPPSPDDSNDDVGGGELGEKETDDVGGGDRAMDEVAAAAAEVAVSMAAISVDREGGVGKSDKDRERKQSPPRRHHRRTSSSGSSLLLKQHSEYDPDKAQGRARRSLRRRFSVEKSTEELFAVAAADLRIEDEEEQQLQQHQDFDDEKAISKAAAEFEKAAEAEKGPTPGPKPHDGSLFFGAYGHIRSQLDYTYHSHYKKERQWLHDSIIEDALARAASSCNTECASSFTSTDNEAGTGIGKTKSSASIGSNHSSVSSTSSKGNKVKTERKLLKSVPWLILTVGAQGAGKRHTVQQLVQKQRLVLLSFIVVDMDEIRRSLPEFSSYVENCPDRVDELTRKEAGYIAETLVRAGLQDGRTVIYDSSLQDIDYYIRFIQEFKANPSAKCMKVGMIHVTAPVERILERSRHRSHETGRAIPEDQIIGMLEVLPDNVAKVRPYVDVFYVIRNDGPTHDDDIVLADGSGSGGAGEVAEAETETTTTDWSDFTSAFCSKVILDLGATAVQHAVQSIPRPKHHRRFSSAVSTEDNHRADHMHFYGKFAHIRRTLDYSYHANYTFERQIFQDAIIDDFLQAALMTDKNGELCTTPTEPWLVFTGTLGARTYILTRSCLLTHHLFRLRIISCSLFDSRCYGRREELHNENTGRKRTISSSGIRQRRPRRDSTEPARVSHIRGAKSGTGRRVNSERSWVYCRNSDVGRSTVRKERTGGRFTARLGMVQGLL